VMISIKRFLKGNSRLTYNSARKRVIKEVRTLRSCGHRSVNCRGGARPGVVVFQRLCRIALTKNVSHREIASSPPIDGVILSYDVCLEVRLIGEIIITGLCCIVY